VHRRSQQFQASCVSFFNDCFDPFSSTSHSSRIQYEIFDFRINLLILDPYSRPWWHQDESRTGDPSLKVETRLFANDTDWDVGSSTKAIKFSRAPRAPPPLSEYRPELRRDSIEDEDGCDEDDEEFDPLLDYSVPKNTGRIALPSSGIKNKPPVVVPKS